PFVVYVPLRRPVPEIQYALLSPERRIYWRGDVVRLTVIVRRESPAGNAILEGRELGLDLSVPFGEVVATQRVQTTRYGTFAADVRVPGSAALGQWRVAAADFADDALAVQVAEFRQIGRAHV